jgi:beta-mannosidase
MKQYNLSKLEWELVGTKPHHWRMFEQMDVMKITHLENTPVKTNIPGSVQQALLDAGLIEDWNIGTNYKNCEWIENRHWIYFVNLSDEFIHIGKKTKLICKGLDDNGEIWLNGKLIGKFNNTHLEYKFDLSSALKSTGNRLAIIFECPERYQGQIYWTSKTKLNKPRFYYSWDWCPRIVQIGIWDDVLLEVSDDVEIEQLYTNTSYSLSDKKGKLTLKSLFSESVLNEKVKIILTDLNGDNIINQTITASKLINGYEFQDLDILAWNPNGEGEQPLYQLSCTLLSNQNEEIQTISRQIGFRLIEWLPCEDANPEADPWLLSVNGNAIFIQGVNWTPIRTMFADVKENQYREWLQKYKDLGANMLRVWGGATIEKECFYRICDEMGLMIWQEFPISSSGICSTPPDDEESLVLMEKIVESYIRRRHFHTSLVAWSGGNELYNNENTKPLDFTHPILACAKQVADRLDPNRRLMPTSPSGPTIFYDPTLNGQGVQWDVHSPWWLPFEPNDAEMSNVREFWESSDALFHSEAGVPGASSVELINKYRGKYPALPINVENPIWGQFSWWIENDKYRLANNDNDPESIEEYVEWEQNRQTKGLSIAVESAKNRFPKCGGFLIWMGHDCFPCPANTSIIDFDGCLKPVAVEIAKIWRKR